jgi:hypothetical protein
VRISFVVLTAIHRTLLHAGWVEQSDGKSCAVLRSIGLLAVIYDTLWFIFVAAVQHEVPAGYRGVCPSIVVFGVYAF